MKYYVVTGEPSGDLHAANLVSELKQVDPKSVIRAWGGERLISERVSLAKHINETAFMGFWSVIKNLRRIKGNYAFCKSDILSFNPDAVILVDYPGFNLKIAEFAKKNGIKVFYYISPKVWAWNKSRVSKIKKYDSTAKKNGNKVLDIIENEKICVDSLKKTIVRHFTKIS